MPVPAVPAEWQEVDAAGLARWILDCVRGSPRSLAPGGDSDWPMGGAARVDGPFNECHASEEEPERYGLESVTIRLTRQQTKSASRALRIVDRRGGVLLADRVGEGKTYIAVALVEAMLARGFERILVTGPAALRPQWIPLLRTAAGAHGARLVRPDSPASRSRTVTWLSHSMLSLRRWPGWLEPCDLVVVDEAHSMRNPGAQRYRSLAWLCRSARVVLLTATPINNSLLDLYHQLRLFIGDGRLADLGVPDLGATMREAARSDGGVRPPLDAAIAAVMVRQPSGTSRGSRPRRVVPMTVHYDLDSAATGLVDRVLDTIHRLDLTPFRMRRDAGSDNASAPELLRFGLVKRFESSPAALLASLYRLAEYMDGFADAAADGYYLPPGGRRGRATGRDPAQLILAPLALRPLGPGSDPSVLVPSARSDARLIRTAMADLEAVERPDPKTATLIRLLGGPLMSADSAGADTRKVVVFTEFRDTAIDLWRSLRTRFRVGLIHGGAAFIGAGPCGRLEVLSRFSPGSRHAGRSGLTVEVDVLIATDVLAEGFNLQAAAHVISFDLPWNPVRLLQRAGRIDRLGSPHDVVYCHSFAPDRSMDAFLRLVDRITTKLDVIRNCMRDPDSVASFAHKPDSAAPGAGGMEEMLQRIERSDPRLFDDIEAAQFSFLEGPPRAARVSTGGRMGDGSPRFGRVRIDGLAGRCWLVVIAFNGQANVILVEDGPDGPSSTHDHGIAPLLQRIIDARRDGFRGLSDVPRITDLRREHPQAAVAVVMAMNSVGFAVTGADSTRARLVNGLLEAVARVPGGPGAKLCARADAVIRQLRDGVSVGIERHLEVLLQHSGRDATGGSAMLRSFEDALRPSRARTGRRQHPPDRVPLAVLELAPRSRRRSMGARMGLTDALHGHTLRS